MPENIKAKATAEGEKKENPHVSVPSAEPNVETFDLDEYVQEKATVPIVKVTVFLDADSGKQLYDAQNQLNGLNEQLIEINNRPKETLAVGETSSKLIDAENVKKDISIFEKRVSDLENRIRSSALLVELQITDPRMPDRVRTAVQSIMSGSEVDENALNEQSMTAMLAQSVVRITRTDGKVIKGPISEKSMDNLRSKLILPEATKLVEGMWEAMNLNVEWMANIDAGFPR